ncbi:MAG: hypothetical protein JWO08_1536 [Verrucomicrobiaceae bacterium]|nr:hypothetical protein [Verrucomicrobiaceae bacterium]
MTLDDSLIITAFGVMGTVITVMWQKLSTENAKLAERADKCEAAREKLFAAVAQLTGDRELLERCPAPRCPLRKPPGSHRPLVPVAS